MQHEMAVCHTQCALSVSTENPHRIHCVVCQQSNTCVTDIACSILKSDFSHSAMCFFSKVRHPRSTTFKKDLRVTGISRCGNWLSVFFCCSNYAIEAMCGLKFEIPGLEMRVHVMTPLDVAIWDHDRLKKYNCVTPLGHKPN